MLQFTPGRDVAMLNALMHTIIDEGLYDRQYVQAHTEGFDALREHVARLPAGGDGPVCGIDAGDPARVARNYARARAAIIFWGMGMSQHTHGTDNARCLISLALMCGPGRAAWHRAASAARPEQRPGRFRRRAHSDDVPGLPVGRGLGRRAAKFEALWRRASTRSAA